MHKAITLTFFVLWLLSIVLFFYLVVLSNQLNAPANIGDAIGLTIIVGIVLFIFMVFGVIFTLFSKKKLQQFSNEQNSREKAISGKRFDLSLGRLFLRFFLTFILGVLFGIAMMPFLQRSEGLYDGQQAPIGEQNIYRMVALWGLFTITFSAVAFAKKHFRMTAVLLLGCWTISIIGVLYLKAMDVNNFSCQRAQMYPMESEFNRSLDLIAQRMNITNELNSNVAMAYQYKNCLNIQYSNDLGSSEGAFIFYEDSNLQELPILLRPEYKNFDDLTIATILVHELSHAGSHANSKITGNNVDCYQEEVDAFTNQHSFLLSLNDEERRSIYTRLQHNLELNPAFYTSIQTEIFGQESLDACSQIKELNKMTQQQFNDCVWDGIQNRLLEHIKSTPAYQEQCSNL